MEKSSAVNYEFVFNAYASSSPIAGTVTEVTNKGFKLDVQGVAVFLPGSETKRRKDISLNDKIEICIIKINPVSNPYYIVGSHKAAEELHEQAQVRQLSKGDIITGYIKAIVDFGVFVVAQGIEGLVHINELSWRRIDHPSEVVEVGQEVKVKLIDITQKDGRSRVSFSIKEAQGNPWNDALKAREGQEVDGTVVSILPYGALVNIGEIDVYLSKNEISKRRVINISDVLHVGDPVHAKIIAVDIEKRRVNISIKALYS